MALSRARASSAFGLVLLVLIHQRRRRQRRRRRPNRKDGRSASGGFRGATFSEGVGDLLEDRSAVLLGPICRSHLLARRHPSFPMQSSEILSYVEQSVAMTLTLRIGGKGGERVRSLFWLSGGMNVTRARVKFCPSGNDERERLRGCRNEWRDNVRQITTNYQKEEEDWRRDGWNA